MRRWIQVSLVGLLLMGSGQGAVRHKNTLKWTPSSWTGVVYRVYRSETKGGPYMRIAGGVNKMTYNDTNVVSKHTYYYRVTAFQKATKKESGYSPEAWGTIP